MEKYLELSTPTSCLNKALFDEPVFVLRAKDKLAPMAVRHWATMSVAKHEPAKLAEAFALADKMDAYRAQNYPEPPATEIGRG